MNVFSKYKNLGENKKKVISNVGWATSGRIIRLLTETLVGIFVARYLGPSQYGLMNYVISYVSLFMIIASFGLENIEIRELANPNSSRDKILGTAFCLRLFFSIITIICIGLLLFFSETDYESSLLILIYSLTVILSSFNVIRNYFTSIVMNKYIVITEIVRCLIGASIKVALLFVHAPLIWFIIALTFDYFLVAGGYIGAYKNKVGTFKSWCFDKIIAKKLIIEAFPLLLSGAAVIVYQKIDQVIIKNLLDNEHVGYFSVAAKFSELILFIPLVMSQTVAPLLVKEKMLDQERYRVRKQYFVDVVLWTTLICTVCLSLVAYPLIRYTYGIEYMAAVPVLHVMAFKAVGMALSNSSGQIIIIEGKQKYAVIRNLVGCILCVSCNYLLIPVYGIIGSAWATIVTVIGSGFICNAFIPSYRDVFRIQINAIISGSYRLLKKTKR